MSDPGQINERGDGGHGALDLQPETIVLDRDGVEVLRIKGVVPLPIGATVQLGASEVDVKVIGGAPALPARRAASSTLP
jgi:hypothetical protein